MLEEKIKVGEQEKIVGCLDFVVDEIFLLIDGRVPMKRQRSLSKDLKKFHSRDFGAVA